MSASIFKHAKKETQLADWTEGSVGDQQNKRGAALQRVLRVWLQNLYGIRQAVKSLDPDGAVVSGIIF